MLHNIGSDVTAETGKRQTKYGQGLKKVIRNF